MYWRGRLGPHRASRLSPSFPKHSPFTLPLSALAVPMLPTIAPPLTGPHSQSKTLAGSAARELQVPACAQPLQPAPADLPRGPPLALMGCYLLTEEFTQQRLPGPGRD